MNQPTLLLDVRNALGECVLWCEQAQCLWWTDILASTLWRHTPETGATEHWPMPERLASFALTSDPDLLLLGLASRLAFYRISSGVVTPICTVESDLPSTRLNDGRCDRQGRFVFGTCNEAPGKAPIGSFYRLDAALRLERLPLAPAAIPNSICFSLDGQTMYYCDSLTRTIRCCDYGDLGSASGPSNDRLFAILEAGVAEPDGSAIDADACIWNAQWGGGRLLRYAPDGSIDRIVPVPVTQPSCVAFGGRNFNELFISSARVSLDEGALAQEPQAGGVFHCVLDDVRGVPESRFAGHA